MASDLDTHSLHPRSRGPTVDPVPSERRTRVCDGILALAVIAALVAIFTSPSARHWLLGGVEAGVFL